MYMQLLYSTTAKVDHCYEPEYYSQFSKIVELKIYHYVAINLLDNPIILAVNYLHLKTPVHTILN